MRSGAGLAVIGGTGLGHVDRILEETKPTPTRQAAGRADSSDERRVYHMIPAQGHVQFLIGQVIQNRNA